MRFLRWLFDACEWDGWRVECWWWLERKAGKMYRLLSDTPLMRPNTDVPFVSALCSYAYRKRKATENRRPA